MVPEQETHAGRDVHAAARDLMVVHQHAADNKHSQAQGPPARGDASDQVVVGNIPRQPQEYQPRADLMAELYRADGRVSVVYAATEMQGVGTTQLAAAYARAKLAEGWRLVAWVDAEDVGSLNTGLAAVATSSGRMSAVLGEGRSIQARWFGTGWRPTGTVVCWCSMTQTILTCCSPSSLRAVQLGW